MANELSVSLDVTFTGNFVQDALAAGEALPDDTTFGSVAFAMHGSSVSFFQEGEAASAGLKAFAETGATDLLVAEFAASSATASTYPRQGEGGTFPQTAEQAQTFASNRATRGWSNLTFLASLSESPDWFVGARNIELRPGGVWIEELEVDLFAWDAGTDNGTDFDSADSPTDPPGDVTSLKGAARFSDTPIGTLTISMLVPPSDGDQRRVEEADAGSLDGALNVFWDAYSTPYKLLQTLRQTVEFDRYLVAWKSGTEEFQTELTGDRVKVVMGRLSDRVILDGLTNGTEYTVRVHHANAVGPAAHPSSEATGTPAPRVRELVSNFSQNPGLNNRKLFSLQSTAGFQFGVVQFTTGSTASTLGSITFLRFEPRTVDSHPRNLVFELRLHEDDDGALGPLIGTFVSPPEYLDGPAKFVAPGGGFALPASTNYWLKLVLIEGEVVVLLSRRDDEDQTGQPGWLFARDCYLSRAEVWPYPRVCTTERHSTHGPFFMSFNSPVESTLPRASITGSSAVEGESVDFTVELSSAPGAMATVEYSTVDGSSALPATSSDGDYTSVSGQTITFAAGETSKTISIATGDDTTDETNERFLVRLSSPSANIALSELDSAAGVILNNDQTTSSDSTLAGITLTDGDGAAVALNETFDRYEFAYTADAAGSVDALTWTASFDTGVSPRSLRYFDAFGKVKEGNRAQASSAKFTRVAPGLNLLRLLVTSSDRSQESRYTVLVTKAASSNATISHFRHFKDGDYNDIDLSPALSSSVTEYTATIDVEGPLDIEFEPNHNGAAARATLNGTTDIPLTVSSVDSAIFTDDLDLEIGENTFEIELTAEDGTTRAYTFTLTLEPPVTVKLGAGSFSVGEGSSVSVPVILNQAAPMALTIPLTATNQGGASASDYSVPNSVAFAVGDTEQQVVFTATTDSVTDAGEWVRLGFGTLPSDMSSATPTTARVDIADVAPTVVNFEQSSYTVAEGSSVAVKVTLDAAASGSVDIPLTVTDQGGATGDDYSTLPMHVTVATGATEGSFTFSALDDSAVEPNESVRLRLGALPAGYAAGSTDETVVGISDDDVTQVAVSLGSSTYSVAEGASQLVTLDLDAALGRTVTIPLSVTHQGGASNADYALASSSVTFNSSQTTRTVRFSAASDSDNDDGESVGIGFTNLPAGVSAGSPAGTVVSIEDDDEVAVTVGFAQTVYTVPEGDAEDITVVLDQPPGRRVEVTLTVTPRDATGADFEIAWPNSSTPGVLVFDGAVRERAFTFTSLADDEEDDGETIAIAIDTPSADGVTLGTARQATITLGPRASRLLGGGGGIGAPAGGGGPSGPSPSEVDFEWGVDRDIEELDSGHEVPTGMWSDGATLWLLDNASGAGDGVQGGRANARGTHPRRRTLAEYRIGGRGQGPRDSHKRWTRDGGPVTSMEVTVTFIALPCSAEVSVWVARLSHSARLLAVAGPIVAPGDPMSRTILRRCTTSRTSTRVKESSPASGGTYRKTFCACHSSACALGPNRRSPGTCMRRPAIS